MMIKQVTLIYKTPDEKEGELYTDKLDVKYDEGKITFIWPRKLHPFMFPFGLKFYDPIVEDYRVFEVMRCSTTPYDLRGNKDKGCTVLELGYKENIKIEKHYKRRWIPRYILHTSKGWLVLLLFPIISAIFWGISEGDIYSKLKMKLMKNYLIHY